MTKVKKKYIINIAALIFVYIQFTYSHLISDIYVPTIFQSFESKQNTLYFKQIKIAAQAGYVYFKQGLNTINIFDENDNFKQIYSYQPQGFLEDKFLVTDNGKQLIVIIDNILNILQFNSGNNKTLSSVYQDNQQSQYSILALNQQQDKIYLIRDQVNFQIISLLDFSVLKGKLNKQYNVFDIRISLDEKWFCLSANTLGLFFYKIDQINNYSIQFTSVSSYSKVNFYQFILFQNDRYIIGLDYWQGISIFDLNTFKEQINQEVVNIQLNPFLLNWWMIKDGYPYTSTLEINKEQTLIYVGARSLGIYAIDITNILKPLVFQLIQIQEDISQFIFSSNLSYLYLSTKKRVVVYQKGKANLQMNYPNLYNKHQSTLSSILKTPYGWRSLLLKDDQTIIMTASSYGIVIAQFNQTSIEVPLKVLSTISYPFITYADNIMLFRNETFLLVTVQDPAGYILDIYDISDRTSPKIAQRIESPTSAYIYSMSKTKDEKIFGCQNLDQLIFYEIIGNIQFKQIAYYTFTQYFSTIQTNDMLILNDYPYVILLFRALNIAALDISNLQNSFLASKIDSLGAEQIVQGTFNTKYCFVAEGLQGISIIDLDQLPNLVIISNVSIKGYTNFLNLILNEQFIITSQLSGGQSALASISSIESPQFISELQYKDEFSAAASVTSDSSYLFSINAGGVRIIPIKANVFIHYEFSEIKKDSTGFVQEIRLKQTNQILFVGQTIQITINLLYPTQGSQIANVYFIRDGIFFDIPQWMVFDTYQNTLTLTITKDSLKKISENKESDNETTKQTVVFVTKQPFTKDSFIFNSEITANEVINQEKSSQIFTTYKNIGILNHLNQISDQFAKEETFTPPNIDGLGLTDEIVKIVQRVLSMSLTYSPIDLILKKSLKIDFTQDENFISSYSKQASIFFQVDQKDGKFVNRIYSSVVTSLSEKQDEIQLQGNIISLNQLLKQQIQIYLYNKNDTNAKIKIQVSDGINNDFINTFTFQQLSKIMKLKKDISINPQFVLQTQIEKQFPQSQILIESQVYIEFSLDTFQEANFNDLQFRAYQIENRNQLELTAQQSEIQFNPQQLKFSIRTSTQDYGRQYCLGINATDSYSWVQDQFCITASVISFEVFLNILLKVLGPLLFFLGIFKYWNQFFNLLFSKKNRIAKKYIEESKEFIIKFIIVDNSYLIGQKLFKQFFKHLAQDKNNLQKSNINGVSVINSCKLNENILKLSIKNVVTNEIEDTEIYELIPEKKLRGKARQIMEKTRRILSTKSFSSREVNYQKFQNYMTSNQTIDTQKFIEDLLNLNKPIYFGGQKINPQKFQYELNDPGSVLYNCLQGLLIKKITKYNKRTFAVYQYIKQISQLCSKNSSVYWTSFISQTLPILKKKKYNEEQIIPEILINTQNLMRVLNFLLKSMKKNTLSKSADLNQQIINQELQIDLGLIINNIITDAIGIVNPTNSFLYPNSGESIHLQEFQVKKVQAYIKYNNTKFLFFKKLFNLEYSNLFSHKNQQLPSWLQIKIEKQLITLYGTVPQRNNYKNIKICIFNNYNCIIRQIILKIKSSNQNNIEHKQYNNQLIHSSLDGSPLVKSNRDEIMESTLPIKLKLQESIQTEQMKTDDENLMAFQKNNFKIITYQQLCESPQYKKVSNSILQSNIQQLNRKITKSINPLLIQQDSSVYND